MENCHKIYDIHVPIIPGILVAPSYMILEKISGIANVPLPAELIGLQKIENQNFEEIYIQFTKDLISGILDHKYLVCDKCKFNNIQGIHFFTMNNFKMTNNIVDFINLKYNSYNN